MYLQLRGNYRYMKRHCDARCASQAEPPRDAQPQSVALLMQSRCMASGVWRMHPLACDRGAWSQVEVGRRWQVSSASVRSAVCGADMTDICGQVTWHLRPPFCDYLPIA